MVLTNGYALPNNETILLLIVFDLINNIKKRYQRYKYTVFNFSAQNSFTMTPINPASLNKIPLSCILQ